MEPGLLALAGRLDHETVEVALEAVNEGRYPGWQVSYDEISMEMAHSRRSSLLSDLTARVGGAIARNPERVWVIVLEERAAKRQEIVKLLFVGGDDDHPIWMRIRADASTPFPSDN